MTEKGRVTVIGAGAWGTALAHTLATNGADVTLWAYEPTVAENINAHHENHIYLPGAQLPPNLRATSDFAEAGGSGAQLFAFVAPSQVMRRVLTGLAPHLPDNAIIVSATKGIENKTLAMPVQIIEETCSEAVAKRLCILSGPSVAKELVEGAPTAVTIASRDPEALALAQESLACSYFRLYSHDDIIGAEVGGATKNVIAIAAGVADGLGFGHNTRAAIVTRGLAEMGRLGAAMGASPITFSGLSGLGDLVLTCTGDLSRNRTVGIRLGKGESIDAITASMTAVAEGVATSLSVYRLAERLAINMPIATEVFRVLHEGKEAAQAVRDLMGRELTNEFE